MKEYSMAEEIDLSASLDDSNYSNEKKARKGFIAKMIFLIAGVLTVATVFVLSLTGFFAVTSFEKDVSLNEDVTRWTVLNWSYGNNSSTITNSYGEWVDENDEGIFRNSNGCFIKLIRLPGASGDAVTDRDGTDAYSSIFSGENFDKTDTDFITVDGKAGRLEVAVLSYNLEDGNSAIAYFRNTVKSDNAYTIVVSCDTTEAFTEVSQTPLDELGVTFKN